MQRTRSTRARIPRRRGVLPAAGDPAAWATLIAAWAALSIAAPASAFMITSQSGLVALSGETVTKVTEYCCDTSTIALYADQETTEDLSSWSHALATPPPIVPGAGMGGNVSATSLIDAAGITATLSASCAPGSSELYYQPGYGESIDTSGCSYQGSLEVTFTVDQPTSYSLGAGIWLFLAGSMFPGPDCCPTFGEFSETVELLGDNQTLIAGFEPIDCFDGGFGQFYQIHSCPPSLGTPPALPTQQLAGELPPGSYTLRVSTSAVVDGRYFSNLAPQDPDFPFPLADEEVRTLHEVSLQLAPVASEVPVLAPWAQSALVALLSLGAMRAEDRRR